MRTLLRKQAPLVHGQDCSLPGGGLVLDADLSMQLVTSPELQALVREAGLPVELRYGRPWPPLLRDDWLRLSVPARHRPSYSIALLDIHLLALGKGPCIFNSICVSMFWRWQ